MKIKPIELKTLGDLQSRGIKPHVGCDDPMCTHPGAYRNKELLDRLGPEKPYRSLSFKCAKCGGKAGMRLVTSY